MSATVGPYGFRPLRHQRTSARVVVDEIRGGIASGYNTTIAVGDPIKLLTTGTFALAAAGDLITAVFAGWLSDDERHWQLGPHWLANQTYTKAPIVKFWPVEGVVFSVQGDGPILQTAIGDAADHIAGTPNLRSGRSGAYLAAPSALAGAAASAGFKILNLFNMIGNQWGDNYTEVEVMVNELNLGRTAGNAI